MKFNTEKVKSIGNVLTIKNDENNNVFMILFEYQDEVFAYVPSANLIHHVNPVYGGILYADGNINSTVKPLPTDIHNIMTNLYKEVSGD